MIQEVGPSETGTLSFDLAEGTVRLGDETKLVVPTAAMMALWGSASPAVKRVFGRALGESIGRTAILRLSGGREDHAMNMMRDASPESSLSELSASWALVGLGNLGLERWGRALVFVVENSPIGADGDEHCEMALEGAIAASCGKTARVCKLEREQRSVRFLAASAGAIVKVRGSLAGGKTWPEAIVELHGSRGGA